jgi:hypothetical protein
MVDLIPKLRMHHVVVADNPRSWDYLDCIAKRREFQENAAAENKKLQVQ